MKKLKRFLAMLMVFIMVFGLMPRFTPEANAEDIYWRRPVESIINNPDWDDSSKVFKYVYISAMLVPVANTFNHKLTPCAGGWPSWDWNAPYIDGDAEYGHGSEPKYKGTVHEAEWNVTKSYSQYWVSESNNARVLSKDSKYGTTQWYGTFKGDAAPNFGMDPYGHAYMEIVQWQDGRDRRSMAQLAAMAAGPQGNHSEYAHHWPSAAAVACVTTALGSGYVTIDESTGYLMPNGNIDEFLTTSESVNKDVALCLAYVDMYMHWYLTGEVASDTYGHGTAKDMLIEQEHFSKQVPQESVDPSDPLITSSWGMETFITTGQSETGSAIGSSCVAVNATYLWRWASKGFLDIHKSTEDQSVNSGTLAGHEFYVVNNSSGETVSGVTDNDGYIHFTLFPGSYTVYEITNDKYNHPIKLFSSDNVQVTAGQTKDLNVTNYLIKGGIKVQKNDFDSQESTPQGDANFEGITFKVKNVGSETIKFTAPNGTESWVAPNNDVPYTFTTDARGYFETHNEMFSYGSYELREVGSNTTYLNDGNKVNFTISSHQQMVVLSSGITDNVDRSGRVSVQKFDFDRYSLDNPSAAITQGDASLAGAVFQVINRSKNWIYYQREGGAMAAYAPGEVIDEIVSNEVGVAEIFDLPYGTYEFKEKTPPESYYPNPDWSQTVEIRQDQQVVYIGTNAATKAKAVSDKVVRGQIQIQKLDAEIDENLALGEVQTSTQLSGAQIQIVNRSKLPVWYQNHWVGVGEVLDVLTTDNVGYCETAPHSVPYGTYELTEIAAPVGYTLNTSWKQTVQIREDKAYSVGTLPETHDNALFQQVIRGELRFNKVDEITMVEMPNVVFKMTSNTTGETHYLVTDENGIFDSSQYPKSNNTNINDLAISGNGTVNESKLDPHAGVWFYGRTDRTNTPQDRLGAFPYDTYTIQELQSSANEDHLLITFTITIRQHDFLYDRGTIDDRQHIPEIRTLLIDQNSQDHVSMAKPNITLIDVIEYHNTDPGRSYTLNGRLMDKATGQEILIDGSPVTGTVPFTAEGYEGTVNMMFQMNAQMLAGKTVVAFVTLTDNESGKVMYRSEDIDNLDETVQFPTIHTTLVGEDEVSKEVASGESVLLIDKVYYENLIPNQTYVLHATLVDKANGNVLHDANGSDLVVDHSFIPTISSGVENVNFLFDSALVEGKLIVAFEELTRNTAPVAEHKDLEDEGQTVNMPKIRTTLRDSAGDQVTYASTELTLVDTVSYWGLMPNTEYVMQGTLMDQASGEPITDENGNNITAEKPFISSGTGEGTVNIVFKFDASKHAGKELVAFEVLVHGNIEVAKHEDITDIEQTEWIPEIHTTAAGVNGEKEFLADGKPKTIVDTVEYEGLMVGQTYVISGELIKKQTGEVLATAEKSFLARSEYGTVSLQFVLDTALLEGESAVAFEELSLDSRIVADHKDLDDIDQTVTFPKIRTRARDRNDIQEILATDNLLITDTVSYENLIPGHTYTLTATLVDKADGKSPKDGKLEAYTGTATFVPTESSGTVDVEIPLNASALENMTLVVFEELRIVDTNVSGLDVDNRIVAIHQDLTDIEQTLTVPKIRTTLVSEEDEYLAYAAESIVLTDTVKYYNLTPGTSYTVMGTLIDKETGEPALDANGNNISQTVPFTPDSPDGTVDVVFEFDASNMTGKSLVAYESVKNDHDVIVAIHEDLTDEEQTVQFPKIRTSASTSNGQQEILASGHVIIEDVVAYENLKPGVVYQLQGRLVDKSDQDRVIAEGAAQFKPTRTDGAVTVKFSFDADELEDQTFVAFETLLLNNQIVATHEDLEDEAQTINFPKIRTHAHDEDGTGNEFLADEHSVIIDTITYSNLTVGQSYTAEGMLYNRDTRRPIRDSAGNIIIAATTFIPDSPDGEIDVVFDIDTRDYENLSIWIAETLIDIDGFTVAKEFLTDVNEIIYIPKIRTTLVDQDDEHTTLAADEVKLTDTIAYSNLQSGEKYIISGILMDPVSRKPVLDANGDEITATSTFVPDQPDGFTTIDFVFDASLLDGTTVVAFEYLSVAETEKLIAQHEDFEDDAQTVLFPKLQTTARDEDGNDDFYADGKVIVYDDVEYFNLPIGRRFKVEGRLVDKETGETLIDAKGKEVTATASFRANSDEGVVTLRFVFDSTGLEGRTFVAYEVLTMGDLIVAIHEDLEDEDQTIRFPEIHTEATDEYYQHASNVEHESTIIDRVDYFNLIPGETYTVVGTLVNKADGKVLKDYARDEVTAETTFVPEEPDGSVEVVFTVDTTALAGGALVAYEDLYHDDRLVASHKDLSDEEQSVYFPTIHTVAKINDNDLTLIDRDTEYVTIDDTVYYDNVVIGREYTYVLSGTLMDAETGAVIKDKKGDAILGEASFTPTEPSGSVVVTFNVPISSLRSEEHNTTKIVAFESLLLGQNTLTVHEDLNDIEQTVYVPVVAKILKLNAASYSPVPGAVFRIEDRGLVGSDETVVLLPEQTSISDDDGYVYFNVLPGHEYSVLEIAAPEDYFLDNNEHIVDANELGVVYGETVLYNVKGGTVVITKTNAVTGEKLAGCEITIFRYAIDKAQTNRNMQEAAKRLNKPIDKLVANRDYTEVRSWQKEFSQITDRKGRIYFYTEEPGKFRFKETATIDGFYLNPDVNEFEIDDKMKISGDLDLMNVPLGTVVVQKTDAEGRPLPGAKIAFWDAYDRKLGEAVTDSKGRVYFVSPGPGKFYYTELEAPSGYSRTDERFHFEVGGDYAIVGQLTLVNYRGTNGMSQGKTGDSQQPLLWAGIAGGSVLIAAAAYWFVMSGKKKKEDETSEH